MMWEEYYRYIRENSVEGSGTAHSYVRALDMLWQTPAGIAVALLGDYSGFRFDKYSNLEYKRGV